MDCIDRELEKFDKDEGGILKCSESFRNSEVLKMANPAQFLKSFFVPSGLSLGFVMGSKVRTSRSGASKHGHMQKHQREPTVVKKSVLVKMINRDSDEEMEDMKGSNKIKAVCGIDESMVADDQPHQQQ